jgi:hypothetical protein
MVLVIATQFAIARSPTREARALPKPLLEQLLNQPLRLLRGNPEPAEGERAFACM